MVAGFVDYRDDGERVTLLHTEVEDGWDGRGFGSRLAAYALDDARRRGIAVVVRCPFVRSYVRRHPAYADLVVAE
jgi:predicted GNAT family acetyltransferase